MAVADDKDPSAAGSAYQSSGDGVAEHVVRTMSTISWLLLNTAILFAVFLFALDNTITADVIPVVVKQFGDAQKLPWLSLSFQIGGTAVVLPFGKLFELFNAKWLYFTFVLTFLAGSALCGAAPSLDAFIVGRVIAGVGGIGIYLGTITLLSANTSESERPVYLGLVGLVYGIGNVVGPVIGGAFADSSATWRWGFYMNLCVIGAMMPVYALIVPNNCPVRGHSIKSRLSKLDGVGILLCIGLMVCVVMGINFGGTLYKWSSGQIITLFVLSGLLFMVFTVQQYFALLTTEANRLFPVNFARQKEPVLLFILTATFNAAGFIPIYYIPPYFQFTRGDTPFDSGVRLLPIIIFITVVIMINGAALSKGSYYMPWFLAGGILALIGGVLMSLITPSTTTAAIYGYQVLLGIGGGCGMQGGYAVAQAITPPEHLPQAIGFIMTAQLLGISLTLSISGSIFINKAVGGLEKLLVGRSLDELQAALLGLSGDLLATLSPETRGDVIGIIVNSLAKVFIPGYVASAVAIICAVLLRRSKMPVGPPSGTTSISDKESGEEKLSDKDPEMAGEIEDKNNRDRTIEMTS